MIQFFKGKYQQQLFPYLLTALLFLVIYTCFNIRFEENDDVLMALIASGQYSGTPDAHLIFSNVIYGYALNALYTVFPNIEWYTVVQVISNIVATSLLSKIILDSQHKRFVKYGFLLFLYSVFIAISLTLQFTYTAGLVAVSGVCLLYRNRSIKELVAGVCLLLFASLFRYEAPLLVLLISSPIVLINLDSLKHIFVSRVVWAYGSAIVLIGVGLYIDVTSYTNNTEWDYYRTYNLVRGDINDNPNAIKIRESLPNNVTVGDYNLLLTAFADPQRMDLETLEVLKAQMGEVSVESKLFNLKKLFKPYFLIWLMGLLAVGTVFLSKKSFKYQVIPLLTWCILLAGLSYLGLELTVKNRVFLIAVSAFVLTLPIQLNNLSLSLGRQKLLMGMIAFFALFLNYRTYFRYDGNQFPEKYKIQHQLLDKYLSDRSKKISPYGTSLMLEYGDPFRISKDFYSKQMYFSGWFSQVPFNKGHFDSFKFFVNGNGLYVTKLAYQSVVDILVKNIEQNYQIKVKPQIVLETETDYVVEFRQ